VSTGQRWAGCIAGLAIGLTSAGTAAAQRPLPDPSPAAQSPAPDPAPGAAARHVARRAPAVAVQTAPTAAQATPAPAGDGAHGPVVTTARVTPVSPPATTRTQTRASTRRPTTSRTAGRRPTPRRTAPPQLRLGAVRSAIAALAPVSAAARPSPGDGSERAILIVAGAALLALAATGGVTLARATARARA
jgi:hypothetical protein